MTVVAVVTALPVFHVTVVERSPFQGYHGDRPFVCVLSFKDQARPGSWKGGGPQVTTVFLSFILIYWICMLPNEIKFYGVQDDLQHMMNKGSLPPLPHTPLNTPPPSHTHTHTHVRLWFQWSSSRHSLLNAHQT